MEAVKVRTGTRALVASKAMMTCVLFVLICAPFLGYFLVECFAQQGTMRTLLAIAAAAPGCGIIAALGSMLVVWSRRRKAVLVVGDTVSIPHSGVSFPTADLTTVQVWSDRSPRSYVAMLPGHVQERANTTGVASIAPYVVAFPQGSDPQPFEFAEMILQRKSDITVDRLGAL